jgi:hypothetical protein
MPGYGWLYHNRIISNITGLLKQKTACGGYGGVKSGVKPLRKLKNFSKSAVDTRRFLTYYCRFGGGQVNSFCD